MNKKQEKKSSCNTIQGNYVEIFMGVSYMVHHKIYREKSINFNVVGY